MAFWGLGPSLGSLPSSPFRPQPHCHPPLPISLPFGSAFLPRARPLFPSPTWLYLVAQLEEGKWGQLLLGLPAH